MEGDRIVVARARTARPPSRVIRSLSGWADSAYDTIVTVRHRAWGQIRRFRRAVTTAKKTRTAVTIAVLSPEMPADMAEAYCCTGNRVTGKEGKECVTASEDKVRSGLLYASAHDAVIGEGLGAVSSWS